MVGRCWSAWRPSVTFSKPKEGGGEQQSNSPPSSFPTDFSCFPFTVNICELDECFHASWQLDSQPQSFPEGPLSAAIGLTGGASYVALLWSGKAQSCQFLGKRAHQNAPPQTSGQCQRARLHVSTSASAPVEREQMEGNCVQTVGFGCRQPPHPSGSLCLFTAGAPLCFWPSVILKSSTHVRKVNVKQKVATPESGCRGTDVPVSGLGWSSVGGGD